MSIEMENNIKEILLFLGEDPDREGLKDTPQRMIKSWGKLFGGYNQNPQEIITTFVEDNLIAKDQIILLKNIEIFSTCEHHFLPFFGKAHVAYIPTKKVVGISKLARIVEIFTRRLQTQERIGNQVTSALMDYLDASAAACIMEAQHMCMTARGVEKQNSVMITSSLAGHFLNSSETRMELLSLIRG